MLPELCSGVTAPETLGGAGMATVQIDPQASPDLPVRLQQEPPSCILNKLPLVTDTHRCLRTTSQDPLLVLLVTLTSTWKRTLPCRICCPTLSRISGTEGEDRQYYYSALLPIERLNSDLRTRGEAALSETTKFVLISAISKREGTHRENLR